MKIAIGYNAEYKKLLTLMIIPTLTILGLLWVTLCAYGLSIQESFAFSLAIDSSIMTLYTFGLLILHKI